MRERITCILLFVALGAGLIARQEPLLAQDAVGPLQDPSGFTMVAPQGFGDRQNTWAWSMQWWRGYLYVGTNRAWRCAEIASFNSLMPEAFPYPPDDPDVACTLDPVNLPMQAEIWRWSAATDTWQRVFQSPRDVPLANGRRISRDIGFRGMNVFVERDGTEALYVAGVSPRFMNFRLAAEDSAPPRLLRSTDGVTFTPVPQDPGTTLGDFPFGSLRNQLTYRGRLYVIGGNVQGSGVLLEAANPAGGNNNFRVVSPPGTIVSAIATFNGYLYVGTRDVVNGFGVYRTDARGPLPYTYTPVLVNGGYLSGQPNSEVLHMKEYRNHLYVGGNGFFNEDKPAELYRIGADDSWDVIAGAPRATPEGFKRPLSGQGAGFGNPFNGHMWRLEVYKGTLYVGTFDSSTTQKDDPLIEPFARNFMGFDLYKTTDGFTFTPVTTTGFGDKFNFGVRSLEATPYGLFLGTANSYYGLEIWRYSPPQQLFLPMLRRR